MPESWIKKEMQKNLKIFQGQLSARWKTIRVLFSMTMYVVGRLVRIKKTSFLSEVYFYERWKATQANVFALCVFYFTLNCIIDIILSRLFSLVA